VVSVGEIATGEPGALTGIPELGVRSWVGFADKIHLTLSGAAATYDDAAAKVNGKTLDLAAAGEFGSIAQRAAR
jgi:hypothetical protein